MPSNPGLGDALQSAEGVLFLAEDDEVFLNNIHGGIIIPLYGGWDTRLNLIKLTA